MKTSYDFPYPILTNDENSNYDETCFFELFEVDDAQLENTNFVINVSFNMHSNSISELIHSEYCNLYIMYSTKTFRKTEKYNFLENNYKIIIPAKQLNPDDDIEICGYIISEEDFNMQYNQEMDPDYDLGEPFPIKKKDIIAISNKLNYHYNRTGDTIIQFSEMKNDEKNFKIDISGDEYIEIKISKLINGGYTRIRNDNQSKYLNSLLSASFVMLAMNNVLSDLSHNGYSQHRNKRWYKIMRQIFISNDIDIENEFDELNESFDINRVYELTQLFMNNYFEKAISIAGKGI